MSSSHPGSWTRQIMDGVRAHEEERAVDLPSPTRYERLEELGRGGMGVVYRAYDRELKRPVALKLLRDDCRQHGESLRRFRREAEAAARLSHPNLVPVFDVGEVEGRPFLVMELIDGAPMDAFLVRRAPPIRERVALLSKVAAAVAYAHEQGVVHRDLKPGNILVTPSGDPKVLDFGLARPLGPGPQVTATREVLGTPAFMAPEQVRGGGKEIGPHTDVYALGVILYGIIADRLPFSRETPDALLHAILTEEPEAPRKRNARVHPDLETICLKAMEKDSHRRYPSAREFRDDLQHFLAGEPIDARPPSRLYRFRRAVSKRRTWVAAIAAAVLAGALAWGGFTYRSTQRDRNTDRATVLRLREEGEWLKALAICERHPSDPGLASIAQECRRRIDRIREEQERKRRWIDETLRPLYGKIQETRMYSYTHSLDYSVRRQEMEKDLDALEASAEDPLWVQEAAVWSTLGTGRYYVGDLDRAEPALLKACTLDSKEPGVILALAGLYLQRANEASDDGLTQAQEKKRVHALHDRVSQLLQADIGSTELEQQVARAYRAVSVGNSAEALELCKDGIARYQGKPGWDEFYVIQGWVTKGEVSIQAFTAAIQARPHHAQAYAYRGTRRAECKDREGALADFAEAVRINPRLPSAYLGRGWLHLRAGRLEEAERDVSQTLAIRPLDSGGRSLLAVLRLERNDFAGALAIYDSILAADPDRATAYVNRSVVRLKQNDWKKAEAECDKALEVDPEMESAYSNRAIARWKSGNLDGALRDFEEAIRLQPRNPDVYFHRGCLFLLNGQPERAFADFSMTIQYDPTHREAHCQRGHLFELRGDFESAIRDYEEAIRLSPSDPDGYAHRGSVRANQGDRKRAVEDFEHALKIAPAEWTGRREVQEFLDSLRKP